MQLHVLEPLFTIFYTFVHKSIYSWRLKFHESKHLDKFKHSYGPQNLSVKSFAV